MDYQILNIIIGALVALFGTWEGINNIRYRRENKDLKKNEVTKDNTETQKKEIDLVAYFKDQVLKTLEDVRNAQNTGNNNQDRILLKLDKLEDTVGEVVGFLDGPFDEWRKKQQKKGGKH